MSKPLGPAWIAGPVGYDWMYQHGMKGEYVTKLGWNFVGATRSGEFRRYRLRYKPEDQKWTGDTVSLNMMELRQSERLVALYRPLGILRDDLPKGALVEALKGMLTEKDKAAAFAVSVRQRGEEKPTF